MDAFRKKKKGGLFVFSLSATGKWLVQKFVKDWQSKLLHIRPGWQEWF